MMFCGFVMVGAVRSQETAASQPLPLFPTNEWGAVTHDCQLGLRISKFEYEIGKKILVMPIVRNVGDKTFTYIVRGRYGDYDINVKKADDSMAPYTDWWAGRSPGVSIYRTVVASLGPHQESGSQDGWLDVTERYKMDAPGKYSITVIQHVGLRETPVNENIIPVLQRFDLVSNPVTITVVPVNVKKPDK